MDARRATLAVIVFIALLVLAWFFIAQGLNSLAVFRTVATPSSEANTSLSSEKEALELSHEVVGDTHTFRGSVTVPSACHELSSSLTVAGGVSPTARISLSVTEPPADVSCARVNELREFAVSLSSVSAPTLTLVLNGEEWPVTFH